MKYENTLKMSNVTLWKNGSQHPEKSQDESVERKKSLEEFGKKNGWNHWKIRVKNHGRIPGNFPGGMLRFCPTKRKNSKKKPLENVHYRISGKSTGDVPEKTPREIFNRFSGKMHGRFPGGLPDRFMRLMP